MNYSKNKVDNDFKLIFKRGPWQIYYYKTTLCARHICEDSFRLLGHRDKIYDKCGCGETVPEEVKVTFNLLKGY